MIPRLLLACVLGLALVTFAPGANARILPKKERDDNKTLKILYVQCIQGQIPGVTPSAAACDGIEDNVEASLRRRHR